MQLIPEGPEIPEELLNAHSEGKVVFFCGAGISVPAGYPMFAALTKQVLEKVPVSAPEDIHEAIDSWDFDFALTLLQKKIGLNSFVVREAIAEILTKKPNTLRNHKTILSLSKNRNNQTRLVTTNFDRLFIKANKKIDYDTAPKLPIPRPDRWDSVVYLHGLIEEPRKQIDLNSLVLNSADFGEAYITDSFCSRFLVELLRHFTVIFIGYSLNDKVMRYLIDAISLSQRISESASGSQFNRPYAFVSHLENNKETVAKKWEAKGVIPITYFVEKKKQYRPHGHKRLYDSLEAWVDLFTGGQQEQISIALLESKKPFLSEDNFTQKRLLWALDDKSGKAAEAIWNVESRDETAQVEWLPFFAENGLLDKISDNDESDGYNGTVTQAPSAARLHQTSRFLTLWMHWHLTEPQLAFWILENGGVPHPDFCNFYRHSGKQDKFKIQLTDEQKIFWDFITSKKYKASQSNESSLGLRFNTALDFNDDIVLADFGELISTKLSIRKNIFSRESETKTFLKNFEFNLVLKAHDAEGLIQQLLENPERYSGFERICEIACESLRDGMNTLKSVKQASNRFDNFSIKIASITTHEQNQFPGQIGELIFLIRESFYKLLENNRNAAVILAKRWAEIEYPIFKRLFFFAAKIIGPELDNLALSTLTKNDGRLIWSYDTKREVSIYIREQVSNWNIDNKSRLIELIFQGPNRQEFKEMPDEEWQQLSDRSKSQKIKKLLQGGTLIPDEYNEDLERLNTLFPAPLPENQSDEFVMFSYPSGWEHEFRLDSGYEKAVETLKSKTDLQIVSEWVPETDFESLKQIVFNNPMRAFALSRVSIDNRLYDNKFWKAIFEPLYHQVLSKKQEDNDDEYTSFASQLILQLPIEILNIESLHYEITRIFEKCHHKLNDTQFLDEWDRVWSIVAESENSSFEDGSAINFAINAPSGTMVETLLSRLWPKNAKVDSGIPDNLKSRLSIVLNRTTHVAPDTSTIIVASRANGLHLIDKDFFKEDVVQIFRWNENESAIVYWDAFLWAARINPDLFKLLEPEFYLALDKETDLSEEAYKILNQMIFIASVSYGAISEDKTREILSQASTTQLEIISSLIKQRTLSSNKDAENYWRNSIMPWVSKFWPRNFEARNEEISDNLVMSAIYSGDFFPELFNWLSNNNLILESPERTSLVYSLHVAERPIRRNQNESQNLPEKFPREVLELLNKTRPVRWEHGMIRQILDRILAVDRDIENSQAYLELIAILP